MEKSTTIKTIKSVLNNLDTTEVLDDDLDARIGGNLSISYIKKLLRQQKVPITPETIDLKGDQIRLMRLTRKLKEAIATKKKSDS